jgi:hypothetical protein
LIRKTERKAGRRIQVLVLHIIPRPVSFGFGDALRVGVVVTGEALNAATTPPPHTPVFELH